MLHRFFRGSSTRVHEVATRGATRHAPAHRTSKRFASSTSSNAGQKRVVLAYSGGLDTSTILKWLITQDYEVIACCADVGQPKQDMNAIREKALKVGAVDCQILDLKETFVKDYIFPMLRANALYESRYLLGTSIARPVITKGLVDVAHKAQCGFLSHGATGKGNDQVRFQLHAHALDPSLQIVAPWRIPEFFNKFVGRQDLLNFAAEQGIPVEQTKKKSFSMDENLAHVSYESGILEDQNAPYPDDMFKMTVSPQDAPDKTTTLNIEFKNGDPVKVTNVTDGSVHTGALELFQYLNNVGGANGVGRVDIVENRFVGMKSRGVYESPACSILRAAHIDLEALVMDKGVMDIRDSLIQKYSQLLYNGFWFSPEMDYLRNIVDYSQKQVDGNVTVELYKGNVLARGRSSSKSLYDADLASMDEQGDYNPQDAEGFITINGLRLKAAHKHNASQGR